MTNVQCTMTNVQFIKADMSKNGVVAVIEVVRRSFGIRGVRGGGRGPKIYISYGNTLPKSLSFIAYAHTKVFDGKL